VVVTEEAPLTETDLYLQSANDIIARLRDAISSRDL
jgi:hypothetical protein